MFMIKIFQKVSSFSEIFIVNKGFFLKTLFSLRVEDFEGIISFVVANYHCKKSFFAFEFILTNLNFIEQITGLPSALSIGLRWEYIVEAT